MLKYSIAINKISRKPESTYAFKENLIEEQDSFYVVANNIDSLKRRDPKGLYGKADRGKVVDLIGYSKNNPYEVPADADLKIDTSSSLTLESSVKTIVEFIKKHSRG